jgi:ribosomal protein S18 acetylase RimI-like enzyme
MTRPFIRYRKVLPAEPEMPVWPHGVGPLLFDPALHAQPVHRLLETAYAHGGGAVLPFNAWWEQLIGDDEYEPALVFLAAGPTGGIVGVGQCWTSAFVKDLAVAQDWRRLGIGGALLRHSFNAFRARGAACVDLKVEQGNPSYAERLYCRLGMVPIDVG